MMLLKYKWRDGVTGWDVVTVIDNMVPDVKHLLQMHRN